MTADHDVPTLEAAQMRVLEMFGAVCADPDNPAVAEQANAALRQLDELLVPGVTS